METLSYEIDPAAGIVEVRGPEGLPGEMEALIASAIADPRFQPGFGFFRDRRSLAAPTSATVRHRVDLVRNLAKQLPPTRYALVVDDDPLHYGMIRMAQELTRDSAAEVWPFTNPDAARNWLSAGWKTSLLDREA